jgi:phthiocerol/phenolphthiocerol synthesis type-I polyketide synthase E
MQRMTIGALDLSVIDPHARDTQYIYDEIFVAGIYRHPKMKIPPGSVLMDVGANIGLFDLWAHSEYRPKAIYAYEASPQTYRYLQDNVKRLVDPAITQVHTVNRAVASTAGKTLTLHQSPLVSGISTLLEKGQVPWVKQLSDSKEIVTHQVTTTTVSAEIATHKIERIELMKIDVEGYFMEVLNGIEPADFARIQNFVIEIDYADEAGAHASDVARKLEAKGYRTEFKEDLTFYAWRG